MREFIYFSQHARTSGNFNDLMKAGRMDIVCNVIIQTFFLSNQMRENIHLHLIFNGPPNPPQHLEFVSDPEMPISKKDVSGLIKRMLYKSKDGRKTKVFPGCFIEKKSFQKLVKEIEDEGKIIYLMDRKGEDIRDIDISENAVFVIGDQEGVGKDEMKFLKNRVEKISIGEKTYFASQTAIILNHELDFREKRVGRE